MTDSEELSLRGSLCVFLYLSYSMEKQSPKGLFFMERSLTDSYQKEQHLCEVSLPFDN